MDRQLSSFQTYLDASHETKRLHAKTHGRVSISYMRPGLLGFLVTSMHLLSKHEAPSASSVFRISAPYLIVDHAHAQE